MTVSERPTVTIKKYANRRLYNTGTSTYVTLEDLAEMVKNGEDFAVFDAKTSEEITRSVLTQIIFEQESKNGHSLLPVAFLRQLIRFYGDSMQMLVPSYLEFAIGRLTDDQHKMREQVEAAMGDQVPGQALRKKMFDQLEEQTRTNMQFFSQALTMFNPFMANAALPGMPGFMPDPKTALPSGTAAEGADDLDVLRNQITDMQKRLDRIAPKST